MGIGELNPMQKRMMEAASEKRDIVLLSPTGSGKTLAFVLPVLKMLKPASGRIQCVVVAPSRELVIQIAGVVRKLATGYKVTELKKIKKFFEGTTDTAENYIKSALKMLVK